MHELAKNAESPERFQRAINSLLRQFTPRDQSATEAAEDFFVEDRGGRARAGLVCNKANRVRADVDNADGLLPLRRLRQRARRGLRPELFFRGEQSRNDVSHVLAP